MSDTPETDKNTWSDSSEGILYKVVTSDFARKLERERDEAIQRRMETILQCELLEKELDKAQEEVNKQKKRATYNLDLAKRVRDFWEKCEKERDEASEKLDEEMKWHHRTHKELVEAQCKLLDIEHDKLKS